MLSFRYYFLGIKLTYDYEKSSKFNFDIIQ